MAQESTADPDRRTVLRATGAASVAAIGGLGGCLGGGGGGDDDPILDTEPDYKGWFKGVDNYRNTKDRRGQESTTVRVGVSANGGALGFGPPAIAVTPGTTVQWDWTGNGGGHNVVAQSETFDSGKTVSRGDATFEYTLEQPGIYRYACEPHRTAGMRGAVFVALE